MKPQYCKLPIYIYEYYNNAILIIDIKEIADKLEYDEFYHFFYINVI